MATIDPLSAPDGAAKPTSTTNPNGLGKDDFLKLLVGKLQHQDPMNPDASNEDFIGQMAQFGMLEQVSNLAQTMQQGHAFELIGKTVRYTTPKGEAGEGKVEKVEVKGGAATLVVGGVAGIEPGKVSEVS